MYFNIEVCFSIEIYLNIEMYFSPKCKETIFCLLLHPAIILSDDTCLGFINQCLFFSMVLFILPKY